MYMHAAVVIYSWNKKKNSHFYRLLYKPSTKTMSLQKLSLPTLALCLTQPSKPVQKSCGLLFLMAASTLASSLLAPCRLGHAGIPCQMWVQNMFCAPAHAHSLQAKARSLHWLDSGTSTIFDQNQPVIISVNINISFSLLISPDIGSALQTFQC